MTTTFLPEVSTAPAIGGKYALYRLFEEQGWRSICHPKTKNKIIFPDAPSAIKAAREYLRLKLNPELRCERQAVEEENDPDILGLEAWRLSKQEDTAKTRALVKNGKHHAPFKVEVRGRRNGKAQKSGGQETT